MIIPKKKTILNYGFFDIIIGTFEILIPAESTNSFFLKLISSESHRLIEKSKIKCWRRRKLPKLPQIKKRQKHIYFFSYLVDCLLSLTINSQLIGIIIVHFIQIVKNGIEKCL